MTLQTADSDHSHVFLGDEHDINKQRTWWVIGLCAIMMVGEIVSGLAFGSIALGRGDDLRIEDSHAVRNGIQR